MCALVELFHFLWVSKTSLQPTKKQQNCSILGRLIATKPQQHTRRLPEWFLPIARHLRRLTLLKKSILPLESAVLGNWRKTGCRPLAAIASIRAESAARITKNGAKWHHSERLKRYSVPTIVDAPLDALFVTRFAAQPDTTPAAKQTPQNCLQN